MGCSRAGAYIDVAIGGIKRLEDGLAVDHGSAKQLDSGKQPCHDDNPARPGQAAQHNCKAETPLTPARLVVLAESQAAFEATNTMSSM